MKMDVLKAADKKFNKRIRLYSIVAFTFIASGFTSFSNHPNWGYWWSALGFVSLCIILGIAYSKKKKKHEES